MKKPVKTKILLVCGARPNFMKISPLYHILKKEKVDVMLVNTGQHYDANMSRSFLDEFGLKEDYSLKPSRKTPISQMTDIMKGLESVYKKENPDLVVVVGDINSTLYAALVAKKLLIPIAHVEAGLRSFNKKMPEETNRIITDRLSDLLFVTEESGVRNLMKEGIHKNVYNVGNIMIDTLKKYLPRVRTSDERFYFATLHRAENIDDKKIFGEILNALEIIAKDRKIYMPLHPRALKMARRFGYMKKLRKICHLLPPLSYSETIYYEKNAVLILTDSGGIQEESTYLGVQCITLRAETERPITVSRGTNMIGGVTKRSILHAYARFKKRKTQKKRPPIPFWDGKTSGRIARVLKKARL
ncbi:MAG: UDP-N-acetylglucosamine 2-epimerase [Candidatus Taylorbacteria bacterium RIFCSPLOWO2_12_FULL_43_20]|uniref:UDP-N-acetylglucosamine 2-epimerase n=1 Tax=Candidatus Taylorbacteria bacterium RIFCSPLOWO2_12_FULL_43_20 TaxID=1802332 RepID=A0A1G2P2Q1_9BACT|nr:MAG: UDP-N-acetylglucosamine 2-epimerase [Candidatus Taylorbacteria bacterium RIFCSPHIGHO2_01_FULL_43_120]OHA22390.1 MAG: UDP-N-acetylglucosamine 2-epimerase [Candidatus Taylorbacteria bacterium RIFCSPHIGHO2_02_FULL_43_55]OHA28329.1 MAG: UDP-N-acetylglucosamine 2-epimerase [Candidatus Taylorbacteria bacterium RIFCSPHIGHO2_12_FULL_42_34]OHA30603.1 MAG: UDP-N-acetylglucosamine 2-epimerase [Candidatus Taylorbacteria bacterium RIFCSPLOWO2_01_FULL_43_83]OHA38500.1 MAG: UDP-N-acetylglucosamine 2-e